MVRNLQAIRFLFSFSIFVSHLLGQQLSTFGLGEYGVSGFFMLSGFILSVAYGKKIEQAQFHTWPFFCKQLLKLYPLHIATFVLAIFYSAHYGDFYEWYLLIPPVFLVQSWIPDDTFHYIPNGSSWSLCGFFFFYLLFNTLYVIINRTSTRKLLASTLAILILYIVIVVSVPQQMVYPFVYTSPIMRLFDFVVGILLFRFVRSETGMRLAGKLKTCSSSCLTIIETIVLVAPVLTFVAYDYVNEGLRCVSLFWLFVALQLAVFYWGDQQSGGITRIMHSKPIMFLGGISFEIYLIHMFVVPLGRSAAYKMGFPPIGIVSFAIAFLISVWLAYVAKRYYVDKVFNALKPYIP